MKPFLILQLRPNDAAADGEFHAFLKYGGLTEDDVVRIRMEKDSLDDINLDDYAAVVVGGGPSDVCNPEEKKYDYQRAFEAKLLPLIAEIIRRDMPYLGVCYGLGALSTVAGGKVSKEKYAESVSGADVMLTEEGQKDPLLAGLPNRFRAILGHKEACQNVPEGAVLLASTEACPVHMIRIKHNVYGVQFHPELDVEGICTRVDVYKNAGYFPPEEAEPLKAQLMKEEVTVPVKIMKRFVDMYRNGGK